MTELCKLAEKWGTDKGSGAQGHGYTAYYHELFKDMRNIKKLLEIGIDIGRSLFMWQEYFPEATIYALDADPKRLINGNRIKSLLCDQGNLENLRKVAEEVGGDFDVMVDDGSHDHAHQILSANMLVPLLRPGGYYIIEDVAFPIHVVPYLPYTCEVKEFDVERDINSKLVVIRV